MASFGQKLLGKVGKAITSTATALNAPRAGSLPVVGKVLGGSGAALGASLQNYGGNTQSQPFRFVQPAYAAPNEVMGASTNSQTRTDFNRDVSGLEALRQAAGNGYSAGGQAGAAANGATSGGRGQSVTLTPPTSGYSGPSEEDTINQLLGVYGQARSDIEGQSGVLDQTYALGKGDVERAIGETETSAQAKKGELERTYGDVLKKQVRTFQDLGRQRAGVFGNLGAADSSAYAEQEFRAGQQFQEQSAETEQQKAQQLAQVDREVQSFKGKATSELSRMALEYQQGKNQLASALSQNNLQQAGAIQSALDQLRQRAQSVQNTVIQFANQAAMLKSQGYNVQTNIAGLSGTSYADSVNSILNGITTANQSLFSGSQPAVNNAQGYIAPNGKRYSSEAEYLQLIGQQQTASPTTVR